MQSTAARTTTAKPAAAQLTLSLGEGDAGGGHGGELIVFRNRGHTCQLTGYPDVAFLDDAGRIVGHADHTQAGYIGGYGANAALPQVRLATGDRASVMVEGIHGDIAGDPRPCPTYTAYQITPPGQRSSARVTAKDGVCYPTVHPIVPGVTI